MNAKTIHILTFGLFSLLVSSCGEYQKALKSDDSAVKSQLAERLYQEKDYSRAERLLEQIVPRYLGKPQGERILFMYADAFYQRKKYNLAAYQFEKFLKNYPKSERAEEAMFLEGKCYFFDSPKYSLTQTDTYTALDKLQSFIDRYPSSEYMREANNMVLELLTKLQQKSFEIAKGYDRIRDYQASIKAFDNFLIENPGSVFREEAMYIRLHSAYELAKNSVKSKEKQRFEDAKSLYENFIRIFPDTQYKNKAEKIYNDINKKISEL
ncbi:MAG: outer membrane protein assembly factor BamD [Capnocytophaga sp.]|nr:outer membrane protein assembly factor BamD [Capnocytophaga sp.]